MGAPVVVAKGGENSPSRSARSRRRARCRCSKRRRSRALYKHCELEQAIPAALTAVAEVMACHQLDAWLKQGGLPPAAPTAFAGARRMDPGVPANEA